MFTATSIAARSEVPRWEWTGALAAAEIHLLPHIQTLKRSTVVIMFRSQHRTCTAKL